MKAERGSRGIAPLGLDLTATWRWVVSVTLRPFFLQGITSVPIEVEAGELYGWSALFFGDEKLASGRDSNSGPSSHYPCRITCWCREYSERRHRWDDNINP